MDIDKLLELTSTAHKADKSLEYKSKMKFITKYLEEGRRPSVSKEEEDAVMSKFYSEPYDSKDDDSWTASEFDIPYKGSKMEGLRVCMNVISGSPIYDPKDGKLSSNYDWRRKRLAVESAFDRLSDSKKREMRKIAKEATDLFNRHEDLHNLNDDEKEKIVSFAELCGDMIQDAFQAELDSSSEGSSGGKANVARMKNLIPCKFSYKGKTFNGLIVVSDPNKKSAMIIWSSDELDSSGNVAVQDNLVRRYWQMKATDAVLEPRLFNGSIRLIGTNSFTVDKSDAKELAKADVVFDDSETAKEFVLNAYLDTLEKLRTSGIIQRRPSSKGPEKSGDDILKLLVGWQEVLSNFGFWSKVSSIV